MSFIIQFLVYHLFCKYIVCFQGSPCDVFVILGRTSFWLYRWNFFENFSVTKWENASRTKVHHSFSKISRCHQNTACNPRNHLLAWLAVMLLFTMKPLFSNTDEKSFSFVHFFPSFLFWMRTVALPWPQTSLEMLHPRWSWAEHWFGRSLENYMIYWMACLSLVCVCLIERILNRDWNKEIRQTFTYLREK